MACKFVVLIYSLFLTMGFKVCVLEPESPCIITYYLFIFFFLDFREESNAERLFLFQEAIVSRFGFIQCTVDAPNSRGASQEHQYIHCTGTVFILISRPAPRPRNRHPSLSRNHASGRYSVHADVVPSPHEAYITRHVSGKNKNDYDNSRRVSFLIFIDYTVLITILLLLLLSLLLLKLCNVNPRVNPSELLFQILMIICI